jgi:hypothetical protein
VTSSTFHPTSVLLDKGVIRRVYERRVRLVLSKPPTVLQVEAANSYADVATIANFVYITEQTANILKRRTEIFAAPLLAETRRLNKARYLRRWARRLTDFGFSSEDAIVLAYGTFGLDVSSKTVGVDAIITTDIRLAQHYERRHGEIENRFNDMIVNLPEHYSVLKLPQVLTTAAILANV